MLRDEIGLEQEAAKRRDRVITWLLAVGVLILVGYLVYHHEEQIVVRDNVEAQKTVFFAGHGLLLPPLWERNGDGSTVQTLMLTHGTDSATVESILLEDLRMRPESTDGFLEGWQARTDLGAQSINAYHDAEVNAVGASCARIDWGGPQRRIKIICLANDGRWKVTLNGTDRDTTALDVIVEQFTLLQN